MRLAGAAAALRRVAAAKAQSAAQSAAQRASARAKRCAGAAPIAFWDAFCARRARRFPRARFLSLGELRDILRPAMVAECPTAS
jgi:hypothetical protein